MQKTHYGFFKYKEAKVGFFNILKDRNKNVMVLPYGDDLELSNEKLEAIASMKTGKKIIDQHLGIMSEVSAGLDYKEFLLSLGASQEQAETNSYSRRNG